MHAWTTSETHVSLQVGGVDSGSMRAVGNMLSQVAGMLVPFLGATLRSLTGQWWPLFATVGGVHILGALAFARLAEVEWRPPAEPVKPEALA